MYDTEYFEFADQKNETLTQSMLIEQASMSPERLAHRNKRNDPESESSEDSDDEEERYMRLLERR